jgi:S-DNA-T family DNA segregation ATPase FtsK/SpoIIIE
MEKGQKANTPDIDQELKETAFRLQETLRTFGVNVTISQISQGPSITRYELQPEQGVKVSRIVNLADDIKLSLAAMDIRIEAPIPGKPAIGIEVPNKHPSLVALRDILETQEFRGAKSRLAFGVGKDLAGNTVVTDIAKMPHLLIAGATGSGKSVCINTIIMSILYKASPDEVQLIMIDPKVVELSVYNGIPHLMIPVVTDVRKASAALNWAVAEMERRYKLFAAAGTRDLNGYNAMVKAKGDEAGENEKVLTRLVVIVDELADLMMVAKNEVESSICRLAQLARAAGIHLIIATQRPSVDVITGLIKANMPSRIAFAVTSQVDSRTILDMAGAEKLIGKGDMLFYPQNYQKPARIQGAFVSDEDVQKVVSYIKANNTSDSSAMADIENQIDGIASSNGNGQDADLKGDSVYDEYFADAGRFIIEKNKASIGMLQRVFKIGFNRAARIMDQLAEAGVVTEENGTRARQVQMDMPTFEQFLEEM